MKTTKRQYPGNLRGITGFFMAPFASAFVGMSMSMLMLYFTDYSGIDTAMGKTGYAVAFGTVFLMLTRIIDAVDDPVQGWLIDSSKECRFGKYRRFMFIGTAVLAVGGIMLYAMPTAVKKNPFLLWGWAIVGYLLYDMGSAMSNITAALLQKVTTDAAIRAKLAVALRLGCVIAAVPAIFYATIVTIVGKNGNLGKAASQTAVILIMICCAIEWIGAGILKEPYLEKENEEHKSAVNFKEIGALLKISPLWVHSVGFLIGNMSYGLAAGVMLYFIKWYFCADAATGTVNLVRFAALSGTYSLITLIPNFLSPFFTTFILRFFKTVDRSMSGCMMLISGGYFLIFLLNITGIMKASPILLFVLFFLIMIPSGVSAQFSVLLTIECADYAEYTIGRNMTALTSSIYNLTQKASSAIGALIPGALLIAVGYSVNEETGAYAGELSSLPRMITGLSLILALVPAIMALISYIIYKNFYKITPEMRKTMSEELERRHSGQSKTDEG